jgi:transcriptional regulator with XRE-family HTH domain
MDFSRNPNPIDVHVGQRVRLRRRELKFSQEVLADTLGLTFQQVQKYESGANRISASKLFEIARTLKVPVGWFFDGLEEPYEAPVAAEAGPPVPPAEAKAFLSTPEGADLAALFPRISERRVRRRIVDLVRSMTDDQPAACEAL